MATSTQGRSTPPSLKRHPQKHVFDHSGLICSSGPLEIVSKLGDSLIDKWEGLMFHLTEYINKRLIADEPNRARLLCKVFRSEP